MQKGLTKEEVIKSLNTHGNNEIKIKEKKTFLVTLKDTITGDAMIKILIFALVLNGAFALLGYVEPYEPVGIFIAVALAVFIGAFSEYSAEGQFRKLQEKASQIYVKIYRDSILQEILINDIVKGDHILLQSGDKVPCDGYLINGSLELNLASLNGETKPCHKKMLDKTVDWDTYWEDNSDDVEDSVLLNPYKIHRESVVSDGKAILIAHKIGRDTLIGKAVSTDEKDIDSPLNLKLKNLAHGIAKFGYIAAALVILFIMIAHVNMSDGLSNYITKNPSAILADILNAIIMAVIILVVAIPEGLPLMTMLVLSLNMKKLLTDNVLVRKLIGIETAGSLNVLYTDKTGTITKGILEVVTFFSGNNKNYEKFSDIPNKLQDLISLAINYNTSSTIQEEPDGTIKAIGGNHTEKALTIWTHYSDFKAEIIKGSTILFNSSYKFSAQEIGGDYNGVLIKGAPEVVSNCHYYYDEDGNKKQLSDDIRESLKNKIDLLASKTIRVLAIAMLDETLEEVTHENILESKLTLVGYVGIRDDIRDTSASAISELQNAGIQVIMITGDRKETATAIATECGIIKSDKDIILTSAELNAMTDEEVKAIIPNIRVISRALPQDKYRLVSLTQSLNLVVAMTGDGVNDAPALERSDVGFGMGSGTETAKEASNIVILDDNIQSIAKAVLYGRTIFNSIRRFIVFQLTVNVSAVLINILGPLLANITKDPTLNTILQHPLTVTQMLWINLVMDTIAAVAFGAEATLKKYMKEKPKRRDENIISPSMTNSILSDGIYLTIISFLILFIPNIRFLITGSYVPEPKTFMTAFFAFYVFSIIFNMFNARTEEVNILSNITKNKTFFIIVGLISFIQLLMIYFGGNIFKCYGLSFETLLKVILVAFLIIPFDIARKAIIKRFRKRL